MSDIRQASIEDVDAISRLHVESWRTAYQGIVPQDFLDAMDADVLAERRRAGMQDPTSREKHTWISVADDGEILGFAAVGPSRDDDAGPGVGEVMAIYLVPRVFGTGIGWQLMSHVLEDLLAQGNTEVTLWVLEKNTRARRFYERAGFRRDGARYDKDIGGALLSNIRYRYTVTKSGRVIRASAEL